MQSWGISDSLKLYQIENWGEQYFSINPAGNMVVHPKKGMGVDVLNIVEDIKAKGMSFPVLIRFQDVIRHRVVFLNETFRKVIDEAKYNGRYQGVYPVKVNQMREVVEEILDAGEPYDFGLEAGSKAELAAVIAQETTPDSLVICNGYKDQEFILTALMGQKLGKRVVIVVEKLTELFQVLELSKKVGVRPNIGIRAKLYSRGSGKWSSSSGEFAKFGLTTPEIIHAVEVLKREGLEDCFKLLHFHIGSQVTNIRTIKNAVQEATRIYAKLTKMGFDIEFLDVGGGLGVDYDGSRTNFDSSINYTLEEYVADVVYTIQEICENEKVKEPNIVSESGRALVAHHSVLVTNVFGNIQVGAAPINMEETPSEPDVVKEIREVQEKLSKKNILEHYHDAVQRKEEAHSMFNLGLLSLEDRAKVETMFWDICKQVFRSSKGLKYVPDEIEALESQLADQYLCNFSVFQSMPDHWAIRHLFPIVPLHRLDEEPTVESTLVDITCDSDGKVDKFIDLRDIKDTLPLHPLEKDKPYYVGFFMMGAYQDIMGDLHNLFGRVNEVHVFMDDSEPNGYYIEEEIQGHKISDLLAWIQYGSHALVKEVKSQIDSRVRQGKLKPREGSALQKMYERLLGSYTYVQHGRPLELPFESVLKSPTPNAQGLFRSPVEPGVKEQDNASTERRL